MIDCPACGADGATKEQRLRTFTRGGLTVAVFIPMWSCNPCHYEWDDSHETDAAVDSAFEAEEERRGS